MIDRKIEAVETVYQGVKFRSALEAKWAMFFTMLGIAWEYEPCTIEGWMPDFLVAGWWLAEVKPVPMTGPWLADEPEAQKAIRPFDTLLLGDGPGDALGLVVRQRAEGVFVRYLVADLRSLPPKLVVVPRMVSGYNFGLADIWNGLPPFKRGRKKPSLSEMFDLSGVKAK